MSLSTSLPPVTPIRSSNPFEAAKLALVKKLLAIQSPNKFPVFPHPTNFTAVADFMRELAGACDELLATVGHEISDNAPCRVDSKVFLSAFTDAIDGNALFECQRCSEVLIEDHNEMMRVG